MQKLKNDIRRELLKSAEELFLRKGFQKTSMREIAETAQVGLEIFIIILVVRMTFFARSCIPLPMLLSGCWKSITGITGLM